MWAAVDRSRWYLVGAAIGLVVLVVWVRSAGPGRVVLDLVERFPEATQARPAPGAFTRADVTIGGKTLKAISVDQPSRLVWEEAIPDGAWLQVSLGIREEAWTRPGDGVLFLVGISTLGKYEELVSLVVNPYGNPADRQWYPLLLDLSPYAGQRAEILLNTRSGAADSTPDNDLAVWGAPSIVVR